MNLCYRDFLGPMIGVVTLATGIGLVSLVAVVSSLLAEPVTVERQENIGVTSSENFKTLGPLPGREGRVLACYDPNILPLWKELKADAQFQEWLDGTGGVINCADMVEIRKVDLNRDGQDEALVRGKGPTLCGATGNCGFWIFNKKGMKWTAILSGYDYSEYEAWDQQVVQRGSTRSYSDILLKTHHTAAETSFRTYKFDGAQYKETRCMYEIPKSNRTGEGSMELITCSEFERR